MQNSAAVVRKSSKKDRANEKSFRIPISSGIFEHCPNMLDAVWLFMWYIDRTTEEDDGEGLVLGGMPIVDSKPASTLQVPVKKVRKWRLHLGNNGYIRTLRTPYGHVITLLKSKKWNWKPTLVQPKNADAGARDLPNREISTTKENARNGHSDLPNRTVRMPDLGSQSAQNGKYKEDKAVDSTEQNSGRNSCSSSPNLKGEGSPPLKPLPKKEKVKRTKPSGRGERQCGNAQTAAQIAEVMECWKGTISHELADSARSNYYRTGEQAQRRCGEEVDLYRLAFAAIDYPFDLSSTVLGFEFCWNVRKVIEENRNETPQSKKWELCEWILDECYETWDGVGTYSDVSPTSWPPDFNEHINRLFGRESGTDGAPDLSHWTPEKQKARHEEMKRQLFEKYPEADTSKTSATAAAVPLAPHQPCKNARDD
jgi:hypothetical protein